MPCRAYNGGVVSEAPSASSGQVLYRKWRPQTFSEVVGQDIVTRTLRNAVASGRLAHAYLFCGPRGTGKTSLGRLLAKVANCASPRDGEPCNACDSCVAFREGRAVDFIEQDAASHNSVDDIRQLRENVVLTPMSGKKKVYLLDEVHMLSRGAYNALLKTLEEPPPHIIFVLATTDPHKVEPTIVSRCQRFDLRRIPMAAVVGKLREICQGEGFSLDAPSLEEIARAATGSLRDAINALEQVVSQYGPAPAFEQVQEALGVRIDARAGALARLALRYDLAGGLKLIASVRDDGVDMRQFAKQVSGRLRHLLLAKTGAIDGVDVPREVAEELQAEAGSLRQEEIVRALRIFARTDFREDPQSSLPLELALIEFVSEKQEGADVPAAAGARPGPRFSIPVAEGEGVASTVTSAVVGVPVETPGGPEGGPLESAPDKPDAGSELLDRVRQSCKESDRQLSALLNGSCEVKSVGAETVVLGFYHTFHLERVESGQYLARLEALFSSALGRPVKLVLEHTPRAPKPPAKGGHLVRAAQELGVKPVRKGDGK